MPNKQELAAPGLEDILSTGEPLQTAEITVAGKQSFTVSYRAMSWLDKSACVAKATEFFVNDDGEPQTMFHVDVYFREALKKMLVDFPWPISDKILNGLKPEVGLQFQDIIPSPLGDNVNLAKGSEKPSKGRKTTRSSKDTQ